MHYFCIIHRNTVLLLLLVLIIGGIGCGFGGLGFDLVFDDGKGLKPGHPVVFQGVEIGKVERVRIEDEGTVRVRVAIDGEHRDVVYREARFVIEKPGGFFDQSDRRQITMYNRTADSRTPVSRGDAIEGSGGLLNELMGTAAVYGRQLRAAAEEAYDELSHEVSKFAGSPEGQELQQEIRQFGDQVREFTQEQVEAFREEHLPVIEENMRELREELEAEGKSDEAEALWNAFQRWHESVSGEQPEGAD